MNLSKRDASPRGTLNYIVDFQNDTLSEEIDVELFAGMGFDFFSMVGTPLPDLSFEHKSVADGLWRPVVKSDGVTLLEVQNFAGGVFWWPQELMPANKMRIKLSTAQTGKVAVNGKS